MNLFQDNIQLVTSLKYCLKPEFEEWKLQMTFEAKNIASGRKITPILKKLSNNHYFLLSAENNSFKLKERTPGEFLFKMRETSPLVPLCRLTAFPDNVDQQYVDLLTKSLEGMRLKNKQKKEKRNCRDN